MGLSDPFGENTCYAVEQYRTPKAALMIAEQNTLKELNTTLKNIHQTSQTTPLSEADLQAFAAELNTLKESVMAEVGDSDVLYVESVHKVARICEIAGRLLIHFAKDPITWSMGVLSLWAYLQLDNLEINHPSQHGCWDKLPKARRFHSDRYYHNSHVDEESWRHRHNILHHSYTGQIDKDPDVTYGVYRLSDMIDHQYFHVLQPLTLLQNTFMAGHSIGMLSTGLLDYVTRLMPGYKQEYYPTTQKSLGAPEFGDALWKYLRKAVPITAYNYGLFGLLAGPKRIVQVTLGTLTAEILRNVFTGLSFYTGHMVEGVKHYDEMPKNRAEWYVQQIEGTANVRADRLTSMLMGHLNYQIEHHLFPKLPPNRLEEVAPKVEALCEKYGVQYLTGSFGDQIASVFKRTLKYALK